MVTTNATLMLPARHSSAQASSVITITGIGDHDQPDWLITMTGIRIQMLDQPLGGDPRHYFVRVVDTLAAIEPEGEREGLREFVPGGRAEIARVGHGGTIGEGGERSKNPDRLSGRLLGHSITGKAFQRTSRKLRRSEWGWRPF